MHEEDWINILKRIIRILKVKWWVYSKHHKLKVVIPRKERPKNESVVTHLCYVDYVKYMETIGWKDNPENNANHTNISYINHTAVHQSMLSTQARLKYGNRYI